MREQKQIYSCRATTVLSGIIGNVSYIVRDFIEGLFPPGFIKHVYIDTSMSSLEIEKETDGIFKYDKPYLIIRPNVSLSDDHIFGRLPDWMTTNYYNFKNLRNNYTPVFADMKNGIYVYSVPDRIKMTFDIEIVASTKMEQLNIAHYLKGSVLHKGYFYLNDAKLETEVPKFFIKTIANIMKYDLTDERQKSDFLNYLETNSQSFVTEKIKASTGNPAYFYLYQTNLLSLFEDYPQIDNGEQKDMTYTNFRITEQFSVDFWCPSNFFLETEKVLTEEDMKLGWDVIDLGEKAMLNYTMKVIPDRTFTLDGKDYEFLKKQGYITDDKYYLTITDEDNKKHGKFLYKNELAEKNDDGTYKIKLNEMDVLDLRGFLHPDVKKVISYNNKYRIDNDKIFKIRIYEEEKLINKENILIDWKTLTLYNINPKPETTYHIFAYVCRADFNRILNRVEQLNGNVYND